VRAIASAHGCSRSNLNDSKKHFVPERQRHIGGCCLRTILAGDERLPSAINKPRGRRLAHGNAGSRGCSGAQGGHSSVSGQCRRQSQHLPPVAVWRAGAPAEQHPQTHSRSIRHLIARHREEWRGQASSTPEQLQCKLAPTYLRWP
jgi:hypothetical protein